MEVKRTWKRAMAFMLALVMAFCFMPSVPAMARTVTVELTTTDTGFTYGKEGSVYFATDKYDNNSEFVHFAIGDEAAEAKGITASLNSVSMDNAEIVIKFTKNIFRNSFAIITIRKRQKFLLALITNIVIQCRIFNILF